MVALLRPHFPERQPGAIELRIFLQRGLEERGLRNRTLGEEALDVVLERVERGICGARAGAAAGASSEPDGQAIEDRKQLLELTALADLRLKPTSVEPDAARRDRQRRAIDAERANDH